MRPRHLFVTFGAANAALIAYGLLALLMPDILLEAFTQHVYHFPPEANHAATYLGALYRLLGWFNLVVGAVNIFLLWQLGRSRQRGLVWALAASTMAGYIGPIVFDNTVGSIGFFEALEHIIFVAVVISALFTLRTHKRGL